MTAVDGRSLREDALTGGERARKAFELLWTAFYRPLMVFARAYRGLPAGEIEDAVAESLIAAFGALARYDPSRPLSPWLYRIAANRFSDLARRARRISCAPLGPCGEELGYDPPSTEDMESAEADRDLAQRCADAISLLTEDERLIAQLRFYEGMDASAIGEILGRSAGTIRWRIHAIRRRLAEIVGGAR
ncbi:MAG: sigma-70 family RNA polymerase sigma factor [Spirochaetaceae bacterium]|nr:sigma-70 family RNA polymerase sigma factor [Spirochaetaceae bacterium]